MKNLLAIIGSIVLLAAVVFNAPRCTAADPDGLRVGGMLVAGCNKRTF